VTQVETMDEVSISPDRNLFFETDYLKADLKGRSVRGGAITMVAQGVKFVLQAGSLFVLARLLTPKDFGLIAMVTAVTGFVLMFKDMGLSMATIQRAEINHRQISTLFWINVAISLGIMMLTAAIAPAIAWFYGEPRLTGITLALAGVFIFGGFAVQHQALLRRQMSFASLALIDIVSMSTGIATGIISALCGAGYWALVLMQLGTAVATTIGVWLACGWRPSLPVRNSGVRSLLAFGRNLTSFNVVNYFARNLDNILIGRFWGAQSLGLYSRAYSLLMLPLMQINAPISAVAIPALSHLQNEPKRYRDYYLKAISLIAFVTMPGIMFMIIMSKDIIRVVLGEQWINASRIFSILGISALIQPILNTTGWLYVSIGRTDRMFKWGMVSSVIIVISFIVGLPFGVIGVATCYTICALLLFVPGLSYACKATPIDVPSIAKVLWPTAIATVVVGVVLGLFRVMLPTLSVGALGLGVSFIVAIVVFLTVLCMLTRGLKPVSDIAALLVHLFPRRANIKLIQKRILDYA